MYVCGSVPNNLPVSYDIQSETIPSKSEVAANLICLTHFKLCPDKGHCVSDNYLF